MKITSGKFRSSTRIAWLLLFVMMVPVVSPLGFLVNTPIAHAQCSGGSCGGSSGSATSGLLGGLLGGGGGGLENMSMFMMLAMMLMQMFQGLGGNTPQQGNVDEQAPQYGSVGPQNTGYNNSGNNNNSSYSSGLAAQSLFLAGTGSDQILSPTSLTIAKGSGFNFFNTADEDQEVRIYKNGTTGLQVDQIVDAENVQVFTFQNAGTYKICLVNDGEESCKNTITVQ